VTAYEYLCKVRSCMQAVIEEIDCCYLREKSPTLETLVKWQRLLDHADAATEALEDEVSAGEPTPSDAAPPLPPHLRLVWSRGDA